MTVDRGQRIERSGQGTKSCHPSHHALRSWLPLRHLSSVICQLSAVLVFALYARCVCFSYIGLDDAAYTFRNPFVAGGLSLSNVAEAFTNLRHGGIWMPVTYMSYMLDASICRMAGLPLISEMHVVNVLLHVVNFLLLWKLIRLLFGFPASDGTDDSRQLGTGKQLSTAREDARPPNTQSAFAIRLRQGYGGQEATADKPSTINYQLSTINYQLSTIIAALAAMIWAVHPLRVEPVAWIAARKELLWTLFTLSGLICWIKSLTPPTQPLNPQPSTAREDVRPPTSQPSTLNPQLKHPNTQTLKHSFPHLLTIIFCALACLSKPTAMCFPLLALLVAWRVRKMEGIRHSTTVSPTPPSVPRQLQVSSSPLFSVLCQLSTVILIAAATAAIAAYSQTHVAGRDAAALYAAPLTHRLVNALSAIGYYIRATFWPFGLHVDCRSVPGIWPLDAGWNFLALGIAVMVTVTLKCSSFVFCATKSNSQSSFAKATEDKAIKQSNNLFPIAWFLVALLPTLGIFGSFGIEAHADRFAYLPSMAFSFLIVSFFRRVSLNGSRGRSPSHPTTLNSQLSTAREDARPPTSQPTTHNPQPSTQTLKHSNTQTLHLLLLIFILSIVTFLQLSHWRDDAAAHRHALACDPGHPRAMVHVADARCSRQRDFDGGIRLYRKALSLADDVPKGGFDAEDVKAKLAYALATRGRRDDFDEVKRLGSAVLRDNCLDRRGMMLDALGTAFMHDGDLSRAAQLLRASISAPDRFWPKASTKRKLELAEKLRGER